MSATPLAIIGAGGLGRETHDLVEALNVARAAAGHSVLECVGFLADGHVEPGLAEERGIPFLGGVSSLASLPADVRYVIAIGNGGARRRIDEWATAEGRQPATLVHPSAVLGCHRVVLGPGSIVSATTVITTNVHVGRHAVLNMGVTIGHDVVLGDYVTVHPHGSISGNVVLEDHVVVGAGATVIPGVRIGAGTTIGAGAAVYSNLPAGITATGVPARVFG